jgi:hypothetical protein
MNDSVSVTGLNIGELQKVYPSTQHVATFGWGEYANALYLIPNQGVYVKRGPYGRWSTVCYVVCDFKNQQDADEWCADRKSYWDERAKPIQDLVLGSVLEDIGGVHHHYPDLEKISDATVADERRSLWKLPQRDRYLELGRWGEHSLKSFRVCDFTDEAGAAAWKSEHHGVSD